LIWFKFKLNNDLEIFFWNWLKRFHVSFFYEEEAWLDEGTLYRILGSHKRMVFFLYGCFGGPLCSFIEQNFCHKFDNYIVCFFDEFREHAESYFLWSRTLSHIRSPGTREMASKLIVPLHLYYLQY
jgi:hypothetical protein